MRIIPAIDIIEGKCVRLSQGDFSSVKIYDNNPAELARRLEDNGISYLHLVDLDAAKNQRIRNRNVLEEIALKTALKVDFGGGIRSEEDIKSALDSGASQVNIGTVAVTDPLLFLRWLSDFGPEKIILSADCRQDKVCTSAWMHTTPANICDYVHNYYMEGVLYTICTDIERDGMLKGPATSLYSEILHRSTLRLIASGGISSISDIEDVRNAGCEGVIIGKALFEEKITMSELRKLC